MTKPILHYFSICGRGELARLVCAAGELDYVDQTFAPAFDESGGWRQGYQAIGEGMGLPSTMPVLEHGDFKLFQSQAIECYVSSVAPKFAGLTPEQRAKDMQFALIKADFNVPTENVLFKKITPEELAPISLKYYALVESLLPEEGFINGLSFPTMADLAVVVIAKGCMPFQAASKMAGSAFDPAAYPKMERLCASAMSYGPVKEFLEKSEHKTLSADPFGIMG